MAQLVKNLPAMWETWVRSLDQDDALEKGRANHSNMLGCPGGSAGKEFACNAGALGLISGSGRFPWRRERQPTSVFWPGESHGLYGPWGHKESDTTG